MFGSQQFSDIIFRSSLTVLEKILDQVLADQYSNLDQTDQRRVFKIGFYASEQIGQLVVMVEIFEND